MIVHHLLSEQRNSHYKDRFELSFIKRAGFLVTVSEVTKESLIKRKLADSKLQVIYPGLNYSITEKKDIIHDGHFNVLFVGTIEERKGLAYAIEALKNIKGEDVIFHIAGSTVQKDYYDNLIKKIQKYGLDKNIRFYGKVSNENLRNLYMKADVFLFLSLWEGYGMVIAEALSFGLPLIVSSIPTMKYFVADGENGFIVDMKNSEQIYEKLMLLWNDAGLREKMSVKSIEKAKELPTWEDASIRHYDLICKYIE
ncbi:MAG: glycosyltransferase family 4 protein [Ignavibacteria bacterium]|nr:glycosyltransferase family 4 protein [Ignavibacteria bacterium]